MTEKRLLWGLGGVTALVLVVALVVCVIGPPEDRVTPDNRDRIRKGMTEREVNAILGKPADHRYTHHLDWVGTLFPYTTLFRSDRKSVV